MEIPKWVFLFHCSTFFLYAVSCSVIIKTVEKDITTPLTTVPTISFPPSSSSPLRNPTSIPETPTTWVPLNIPSTSSSQSPPVNAGASWCVASQTAFQPALQAALDYACGHGADCSVIQPDSHCYYPNTMNAHASYAFNSYYQKNPIPNSCNFGGTAVITSTDPSSGACTYPSTSTSSSVLDTANQNISTVFGAGTPGSPISAAARVSRVLYVSRPMWFLVLLLRCGF